MLGTHPHMHTSNQTCTYVHMHTCCSTTNQWSAQSLHLEDTNNGMKTLSTAHGSRSHSPLPRTAILSRRLGHNRVGVGPHSPPSPLTANQSLEAVASMQGSEVPTHVPALASHGENSRTTSLLLCETRM